MLNIFSLANGRLFQEEIETLEERLSAIDPDDSMAVEELDGFCAALACSPRRAAPAIPVGGCMVNVVMVCSWLSGRSASPA